MKKVIGAITIYHGSEHRYLRGHQVKIIAVLKNAARDGIDVDGPEYASIDDNEDLQRAGGITTDDRVEVTPWLEKEGRFSFASSDPLAQDLACFKAALTTGCPTSLDGPASKVTENNKE